MPRDIFSSSSLPEDSSDDLSITLGSRGGNELPDESPVGSRKDRELQLSNALRKQDELHPYVSTLNLSDLETVVALCDAVFPAEYRPLKEQVCCRCCCLTLFWF